MSERPNILWICSDQQRHDTLGCYGNRWVHTPHLDALASQGLIFRHAFAQSPVCTPSRASFLTGRYPRTCRTRQNGADIPDDEVLVTKLLADEGYHCGLAGKLHLRACHPSVCPQLESRLDDGYAEFYWSHHPQDDWPLPAHDYGNWVRAQGGAIGWKPCPECRYVRVGMPEELHQTTWCAQRACEFIERRAAEGGPWLFSVNMFDPHPPFDPPPAMLERYVDQLHGIPLPNYVDGELDHKPSYQQIDHGVGAYGGEGGFVWDRMSITDHRWVRAAYWAMCNLIDKQVGRILDTLDRTGQRDSTLVIFMCDHGEMLGDHGIYHKGPYFYECAIRVPLIFAMPGLVPSGATEALVELVDLAPTLLDAAGLPRYPGMQGRSLWPMLLDRQRRSDHREDIYCESYNAMPRPKHEPAYLTMVRTNRYKLVVDHRHDDGELYDLVTDPNETRNLWDHSDHAKIKAELFPRLCNRMAFTMDPLPARRSGW